MLFKRKTVTEVSEPEMTRDELITWAVDDYIEKIGLPENSIVTREDAIRQLHIMLDKKQYAGKIGKMLVRSLVGPALVESLNKKNAVETKPEPSGSGEGKIEKEDKDD